RLAGAVRAEQREDLAGPDPERHLAENGPAAVRLDEAGDVDGRRGALRRYDGRGRLESVRHDAPAIAAKRASKSASFSGPIAIERRIPARSTKKLWGRPTTWYAFLMAAPGSTTVGHVASWAVANAAAPSTGSSVSTPRIAMPSAAWALAFVASNGSSVTHGGHDG